MDLGLLLISSLAVLGLYYSQPFDADFSFSEKVDYAAIDIQTHDNFNNQISLVSAEAEIGSVELDNNGYFSRMYSLPNIVGCINLAEDIDETSILLRENQFQIEYRGDGTRHYSGQRISVSVDDEKSMKLVGVYRPFRNDVSLDQFARENIESISIYILDNKEENPIAVDYPIRDYDYYGRPPKRIIAGSCSSALDSRTPDAVIPIN